MSGEDAFKLSDTFGFPVELTRSSRPTPGCRSMRTGSRALLQEQRERAGASREEGGDRPGHRRGAADRVRRVRAARRGAPMRLVLADDNASSRSAEEGQPVRLFLARTPFYAEGGGQVGDRGVIRTPTGTVRVTDTQKAGRPLDRARGRGRVRRGRAAARMRSQRSTGRSARATARAHTSTHVDPRDAPADLGRPRPAGGIADRARPAALRLHPSELRADRGAGGSRARVEPPSSRPTTASGVSHMSMDEARRSARRRCSTRSTATWSAGSRSATVRASCAGGRTSTARARSP